MRRKILIPLLLLAAMGIAPSSGAGQGSVSPAATPPAIPVIEPVASQIAAGAYKLDIIKPLPDGRCLAIATRYDLDVARLAIDKWRWWVTPLLALCGLIPAWLVRRNTRRARKAGVEYCKKCGYCLTGAVSAGCPECGTELTAANRVRARFNRRQPALLAVWLALLVTGWVAMNQTADRWTGPLKISLSYPSTFAMRWAAKLGYSVVPWRTNHGPVLVELRGVEVQRELREVLTPPMITSRVSPFLTASPDGLTALCGLTDINVGYDQAIGRTKSWMLLDTRTGKQIFVPSACLKVLTEPNDLSVAACFSLDSQSLFVLGARETGGKIVQVGLFTDTIKQIGINPSVDTGTIRQIAPDRLVTTWYYGRMDYTQWAVWNPITGKKLDEGSLEQDFLLISLGNQAFELIEADYWVPVPNTSYPDLLVLADDNLLLRDDAVPAGLSLRGAHPQIAIHDAAITGQTFCILSLPGFNNTGRNISIEVPSDKTRLIVFQCDGLVNRMLTFDLAQIRKMKSHPTPP